jgi:hypothetical protein
MENVGLGPVLLVETRLMLGRVEVLRRDMPKSWYGCDGAGGMTGGSTGQLVTL